MCVASTKTGRDPTSWSEGRNLVLAQGQEGGADEGRGQLRRLAREALEATTPTGAHGAARGQRCPLQQTRRGGAGDEGRGLRQLAPKDQQNH